jgi:hypothetical protein
MNPPFPPLTLGDIFEKTFSLIGKTFFRNLCIAVLILLFPIILMAIAADDFYSSLADMQDTVHQVQSAPGLDMILPILSTLSFFLIATLVFALGVLFAEIAISIVVSNEISSHPITFSDALSELFDLKWLYGIGQAVLKFLIFIGGIIILGIILAIFSALSKMLMGLMVVLCLLVLIPVIAYIALKWYFSLTAIAVDDLTIIESLRTSWYLVEGYWWRTFGILLLLSILTQFAISIVSLPITFGSMWDVYKEYFTMLGKTGGNINPEMLRNLEKSFGPGIAIGSGISALLSLLVTPVYMVVLYYDLRARGNTGTTVNQNTANIQDAPQEPIDLGQF